ncbi:hypothetical protein GJ496_010278 [Pomphorhynchus laevis]|nr:hypothetical protein GJ496_010278 [Pomphorhynchus laevis]
MNRLKSILLLALLCAIGSTLLLCACLLPKFNWWPIVVVLFYLLVQIPIHVCKTSNLQDYNPSSIGQHANVSECACFCMSVLVVSAFGYPVILARSSVIKYESMALVLAANVVIYLTIFVFYSMDQSDSPRF